jgi:hypothetical protein
MHRQYIFIYLESLEILVDSLLVTKEELSGGGVIFMAPRSFNFWNISKILHYFLIAVSKHQKKVVLKIVTP